LTEVIDEIRTILAMWSLSWAIDWMPDDADEARRHARAAATALKGSAPCA
jgi:hypothetical protein